MPASLLCDLETSVAPQVNGSGPTSASSGMLFEEPRAALRLAYELTMLGLNDNSVNPISPTDSDTQTLLPTSFVLPEDNRNKKSQNMTECVPVPSSEHVAEIVGRQGCKIKALRAKTNTYIKTPVRGEEPVFVVTGRKEDVAKAKREILSAAEHFSQIRASRKNNLTGLGSLSPPGPPANLPGHVTIQVRVPYRVVGLVVGPKGATIKRIQHQTHTYIVTPSRDKEPVFDVTGLPESVDAAKREIEAHIAVRTGNGTIADSIFSTDASSILNNAPQSVLEDLCKTGFNSLFNYVGTADLLAENTTVGGLSSSSDFSAGSSGCSGCSSASSSSSASGATGLGDLGSIWSVSLDRDEGIGESPSFETATATSSIWSFPTTTGPSPAESASPAESITGKRDCILCGEREITAALVPCGHNLFCIDCGNGLCRRPDPKCPVCSVKICQAIKIIS